MALATLPRPEQIARFSTIVCARVAESPCFVKIAMS
jgi:hypothetical protein